MKKNPRGISGCPGCGSKSHLVRIDKFDAMACSLCKTWLEKKCSQVDCSFCTKRPSDMSKVDWDDRWNTRYG